MCERDDCKQHKCPPMHCVNPCRERVLKEKRYFMYLLNTYDVINWTLRCGGGGGGGSRRGGGGGSRCGDGRVVSFPF